MTATTSAINGVEYLVEVGDVLAFDAAGYRVDGVLVSGFGTPAYFHSGGGAVFSFREAFCLKRVRWEMVC